MYHRIPRHSRFESWWKRQRQVYLPGRWHDHPQCALWGECLTAYQRFEQANGCICGHRLFAEHRWSLVGDSGFTGRRLSSCHQLDGHYRPNPPPCSLQMVSRPCGNSITKSAQLVCKAKIISSSVASSLPNRKFSRMVPLINVLPCGTYTKLQRWREESS